MRQDSVSVQNGHVFSTIWRGDNELAGRFVEAGGLELDVDCGLDSFEGIAGVDLHSRRFEGEIDRRDWLLGLGVDIHRYLLADLLDLACVSGGFLAVVDELELLGDLAAEAGLEAHRTLRVGRIADQLQRVDELA